MYACTTHAYQQQKACDEVAMDLGKLALRVPALITFTD